MLQIYTIGHSKYNEEEFRNLLNAYNISVLIDVRSKPYSKQVPLFNKENLEIFARKNSVKYKFAGKYLGGRPSNPKLYTDGIVDYSKMSQEVVFIKAIRLLYKATELNDRMCLMCAEANPLECHRGILIGRELSLLGVSINHIISMSETISQEEINSLLLDKYFHNVNSRNIFGPTNIDYLAESYRKQNMLIGFRNAMQ